MSAAMRKTIPRNINGALLAESAAGMWLVISGMILGTLLLLNVGAWIYYKEKLGFIADLLSKPRAPIQA